MMGVSNADAEQYIGQFETVLPKYGIAGPKQRLAHFFAQILHESGCLHFDMENLNYSADALLKVFPSTSRRAPRRRPMLDNQKIANRVYASRMGNGDEASGDGWKYRGRGLIQLTGKDNYKSSAAWIGEPRILDEPDLVSSEYAVHSAVYFGTAATSMCWRIRTTRWG
ncbi:MAG: hypothetical protein U0132_02105 [Gemmatimonadaceae bacterium]